MPTFEVIAATIDTSEEVTVFYEAATEAEAEAIARNKGLLPKTVSLMEEIQSKAGDTSGEIPQQIIRPVQTKMKRSETPPADERNCSHESRSPRKGRKSISAV